MAKTQVLRYWMNLPDKDLVDTLNAELDAGGGPTINPHGSILVSYGMDNGLYQAPDNASAAILPALYPDGPTWPLIDAGAVITSPSVTSEWFTGGFNFPTDVGTFTRKSGGWFGIPLLFGTTTRFYWSGRFRYQPNPGDPEAVLDSSGDVIPPENLKTRYFLETFELGPSGNGASWSSTNARTTRDAGGQVEGIGIGLRKGSAAAISKQTYAFIVGGSANAPTATWNRIYFTVQTLPSTLQVIWYSEGLPTASSGVVVGILPSGQLVLYNRDTGTATLMDTSTHQIEAGRPYRLDIITHWNTVATPNNTGNCQVYLCGEEVMSFVATTGIGAQGVPPQREQQSSLSNTLSGVVATSDADYEIDYHFWMCAAPPTDYSGIDWLHGSRGLLLEATGQGSDFANWTASMFRLIGNRVPARADSQNLVSTTSGAVASYTTDIVQKLASIQNADGIASFVIGLYGFRGTNSGTLGYKLNAGANVMSAITQGAGPNPGWNNAFYSGPTSSPDPIVPTALNVVYIKGADIVQAGIQVMAICAEVIGIFSRADLPLSDTTEGESVPSRVAGVHNSAYPDTPWGSMNLPLISPFMVKTGTYVGNGTTQDIQCNAPPVFVCIHRHSGAADTGAWFTTAMLGAHINIEEGINPYVRCLRDHSYAGAAAEDQQEMRFLVRVGGPQAQVNTNAVTYSYFILCDPGARFVLSHASTHSSSGTLPRTEPLAVDDFTPVFAVLFAETLTNTSTARLYFKDVSVITVNAMLASAGSAETANSYTFGTGTVITRTGLLGLATFEQICHLLFRLDDGNVSTGVPFGIVSYTGDGSASRTVAVDLGGKRPLWALVGGNLGFWRDPTHTSTNSGRLDTGGNTTTGITGGGIDSISVGSSINSNGTPYTLLVFPGSTTAGNGGWSVDGEFWPVEPDTASPDDWFEPEIVTPTESQSASSASGGGAVLTDEPDMEDTVVISNGTTNVGGLLGGQVCEYYTRKLVNIALSRIGVSKVIGDLVNDNTEVAIMARRHVKEDVNAVLRDFPWPFATRYAELVLVDGSESDPVNQDWTFSYRAPNSMMFARRIITLGAGRAPSTNPSTPPIPYREATDSVGALIYCNTEATDDEPLMLEYTVRNLCPAFFGDALFRDALAWRFASSLAVPLSRGADRAKECLEMYYTVLPKAKVVAANESQQEPGADADWIRDRG